MAVAEHLIGRAAELGSSAAIVALDELPALDLIGPTQVPGRFRVRHALVHRAVYEVAA